MRWEGGSALGPIGVSVNLIRQSNKARDTTYAVGWCPSVSLPLFDCPRRKHCNVPGHFVDDIRLIPLDLIHTINRDFAGKARKA